MATTITPLTVSDDTGTVASPNDDGTTIDAELFQTLESNINALLANDLTLGGDLTLEGGDLDITGAATVSSTVSATGGYKERGRSAAMGEWIAVPFSATNFTSFNPTDDWDVASGDVVTNRYTLIGKTLIWSLRIANSAPGTPTELRVTIPGGFTAAAAASVRVAFSNVQTVDLIAESVSGQTYIAIKRVDSAAFTSSGTQFIYLQIAIEVS